MLTNRREHGRERDALNGIRHKVERKQKVTLKHQGFNLYQVQFSPQLIQPLSMTSPHQSSKYVHWISLHTRKFTLLSECKQCPTSQLKVDESHLAGLMFKESPNKAKHKDNTPRNEHSQFSYSRKFGWVLNRIDMALPNSLVPPQHYFSQRMQKVIKLLRSLLALSTMDKHALKHLSTAAGTSGHNCVEPMW